MELSQYSILTKKGNDYLLINTKTGYVVKIYGDIEKLKFEKIINTKFDFDDSDNFYSELLEMGFIVEDFKNEFKQVKSNFDYYFSSDYFLRLTLIVTENCNFKCKYCYEEHNNISFTKELYNAIYNTIETGIVNGRYKNIEINFFGGEPMLQYSPIIDFLKKLNELILEHRDVNLSCTMVTNGYFLTLPKYEILSKLGIKNYQITVDGMQKDHDLYRPLVNGEGTWSIIINNLKDILKSKVKSNIYLRSNINSDISKKYFDFLYYIKKNLDNNFILQLSPIKKFSENVIGCSNDENIDEIITSIYDKSKELNIKTMMQHGLDFGCMACKMALPNSYVIDPYGNLSKCSVYFKDDITKVGKIMEDGLLLFNEKLSLWDNDKLDSKCENCKLFPLCGNRSCPYVKIKSLNSESCEPNKNIDTIKKLAMKGLI
ncbi:radical SAM/SPASM domain-containing protein [Anaerosalibacter sp. Marseille-P3206]|uniref:radical SAM/SPASM domain-containing protein n=1 Tax=Anaerosalibacter sp. Marseille-P3206 TaxID=1871005 RepID=UPI000985B7C1|nr:radical SAM protein [Anaerosalibacter sp. Marseille-P3206]